MSVPIAQGARPAATAAALPLTAAHAATPERRAQDCLLFADIHDAPMPLDFFVWTLTRPGTTIVLDTGFSREASERRGRAFLRRPAAARALAGVDAARGPHVHAVRHAQAEHSVAGRKSEHYIKL